MEQVVAVEFGWTPETIQESDFRGLVAAYISGDKPRFSQLCADAKIVGAIDARGLRCPYPVAMMRKALAAMKRGESLVLLADDPLARLDVQNAVYKGRN
ncbi:hypothetical protein N181_18400 [Sinorhizobium fredii USDA 205]|uniref:sulfurtransferase TusA family protein n=1 Tax=Rhizobium fredii TaxID=380 RepID=UPI0004B2F502|nr:sulfurtransferase TusA family protein [Sinorhizobium fredii]ASY71748.1 hypothetical protein SF83666_b50990 [Sinorhizobium fredii CCBAU 83666]AWM27924.1 hypothetical protein AOX55_00005146 [Sinorhizobium fredii CCBAU 25509]KSV87656.1 hypothetical protein N181_18400 [Sinorhizobium fredii USDA 205]GEC32025.1 hypothetical protein EFR01_21960 [Sinorhizobium fredii]GLS08066.1 hypothetical protein GCM10007864_16940 [Sinorhizobium fredii]